MAFSSSGPSFKYSGRLHSDDSEEEVSLHSPRVVARRSTLSHLHGDSESSSDSSDSSEASREVFRRDILRRRLPQNRADSSGSDSESEDKTKGVRPRKRKRRRTKSAPRRALTDTNLHYGQPPPPSHHSGVYSGSSRSSRTKSLGRKLKDKKKKKKKKKLSRARSLRMIERLAQPRQYVEDEPDEAAERKRKRPGKVPRRVLELNALAKRPRDLENGDHGNEAAPVAQKPKTKRKKKRKQTRADGGQKTNGAEDMSDHTSSQDDQSTTPESETGPQHLQPSGGTESVELRGEVVQTTPGSIEEAFGSSDDEFGALEPINEEVSEQDDDWMEVGQDPGPPEESPPSHSAASSRRDSLEPPGPPVEDGADGNESPVAGNSGGDPSAPDGHQPEVQSEEQKALALLASDQKPEYGKAGSGAWLAASVAAMAAAAAIVAPPEEVVSDDNEAAEEMSPGKGLRRSRSQPARNQTGNGLSARSTSSDTVPDVVARLYHAHTRPRARGGDRLSVRSLPGLDSRRSPSFDTSSTTSMSSMQSLGASYYRTPPRIGMPTKHRFTAEALQMCGQPLPEDPTELLDTVLDWEWVSLEPFARARTLVCVHTNSFCKSMKIRNDSLPQRKMSTFRVVEGLSPGVGLISLQVIGQDKYLRRDAGGVRLDTEPTGSTVHWRKDATWKIRSGFLDDEYFVSLESVSKPNQFMALRSDYFLEVRKQDDTAKFKKAATFRFVPPPITWEESEGRKHALRERKEQLRKEEEERVAAAKKAREDAIEAARVEREADARLQAATTAVKQAAILSSQRAEEMRIAATEKARRLEDQRRKLELLRLEREAEEAALNPQTNSKAKKAMKKKSKAR